MMKMNTNLPGGKLLSLEEGSVQYEDENEISFFHRIKKHSNCEQFIRILKVILLFELIFFIGWIGCIFLSNHIGYTIDIESKSETINTVGSFAMKYTPPDINNQINFEYDFTGYRHRRSSEETKLTVEICESRVNATREKFKQLTEQFILGEDSDTTVIMLREMCRQQMVGLTLRVMTRELISNVKYPVPSDEEWHNFTTAIKQGIMDETDGNYTKQIEASGPPTQGIVDELRTAIHSMISNYKKCEKILPIGGETTSPSLADLLNDREKCENFRSTLIEDVRSLVLLIVPVNSSAPMIIQLRDSVENMTITLADNTMSNWPTTNVTGLNDYLSDEQLRNYIVLMKADVMNSADPEYRRQIEESGSSMQEMINKTRSIVNNYVTNYGECEALRLIIREISRSIENSELRAKRDSKIDPERRYSTIANLI